jgi:hypothetical protein
VWKLLGLNLVKDADNATVGRANCPIDRETTFTIALQEKGSVLKFFEMGKARASHLIGVDLSSGTNREAKSIWKTPQSLGQVETNVGWTR